MAANCVVVVVESLKVLVDDGVRSEKAPTLTVEVDEERKSKRNVEIFILTGKRLG